MEINLLSFIPIISSTSNQYRSETTLKYFLVQALSSSSLILGLLCVTYHNYVSTVIITIALLIKIGAAPFHFWFIEVMTHMTWTQIIILNTLQKISPIILISYTMFDYISQNLITLSVILCSLLGGFGGFNQRVLVKIIAYSSLGHIGWIIQGITISTYLWFLYFSIYCLLLTAICLMFNFFKIKHLRQITNKIKEYMLLKVVIAFSLISLAGLPPFSGFMGKIIVIQYMINGNQILLALVLIISSLINLFFYFRIFMSNIILSSNKNKFSLLHTNLDQTFSVNLTLLFNFVAIFMPSIALLLL